MTVLVPARVTRKHKCILRGLHRAVSVLRDEKRELYGSCLVLSKLRPETLSDFVPSYPNPLRIGTNGLAPR